MTEQEHAGVMENVADSQEQLGQMNNSQDKNWKAVHETLAQQKQEANEVREQLRQAQDYIANLQKEKEEQINSADLEDFSTKGDVMRLLKEKEAQFEQRLQYYEAKLQNPDYDSVINEHYADLAKSNPRLNQAVLSSKDASLLAYELGKARQLSKSKAQKEVDRIVENAQKPTSINNAVGGGASAISHADKIRSMTRQEFEAYTAKVMRNR